MESEPETYNKNEFVIGEFFSPIPAFLLFEICVVTLRYFYSSEWSWRIVGYRLSVISDSEWRTLAPFTQEGETYFKRVILGTERWLTDHASTRTFRDTFSSSLFLIHPFHYDTFCSSIFSIAVNRESTTFLLHSFSVVQIKKFVIKATFYLLSLRDRIVEFATGEGWNGWMVTDAVYAIFKRSGACVVLTLINVQLLSITLSSRLKGTRLIQNECDIWHVSRPHFRKCVCSFIHHHLLSRALSSGCGTIRIHICICWAAKRISTERSKVWKWNVRPKIRLQSTFANRFFAARRYGLFPSIFVLFIDRRIYWTYSYNDSVLPYAYFLSRYVHKNLVLLERLISA